MDSSTYAYDSHGTVSAVFLETENADKAYHALMKRGYSRDEISLLMSDETLNKHFNQSGYHSEPEAKLAEQPKISLGTMLGGTAGAITGILYALTLGSIPRLRIACPWWIAGLTGAAAGAITGRAIGNIICSKVEKENTGSYEDGVKEGGIIISVDPRNIADRNAIISEFKQFHGQDILGNDGYAHLD
ncbi:hypothetical protein [Dyadobacter sediminis]|uniref:Glycine zipper family protein n=1 Tax=Dyadobacter sediminis TaxID=1493691 RepID=A0A5R9KF52_9BACT|nr:hypothetical protein [Dyadobacter sediminis]TLU94671.1 hypothetical protein FEM55_10620 [Dyadobacter sediminis]GGB89164.1 hypothetical protein GCM10011325_15840 [Dyadobacter sediminis]